MVLVDHLGAPTKKTLHDQIESQRSSLPDYLFTGIDMVRTVGNFSAHPLKDTQTGAIVGVEPGEAEYCLDVLNRLFDFVFVQPAKSAQAHAAWEQRLASAGKPPLKKR